MSRQYDVITNPDRATRAKAPYLVILQSHHLRGVHSTLVAPLFEPAIVAPDEIIALTVTVRGQTFTLAVNLLTNVDGRRLGRAIASLEAADYDIQRAVQRLFTGF